MLQSAEVFTESRGFPRNVVVTMLNDSCHSVFFKRSNDENGIGCEFGICCGLLLRVKCKESTGQISNLSC